MTRKNTALNRPRAACGSNSNRGVMVVVWLTVVPFVVAGGSSQCALIRAASQAWNYLFWGSLFSGSDEGGSRCAVYHVAI